MDADKVVTATFVAIPPTYYSLTMSLVDNGIITPHVGTNGYLSGVVVNLSASPATGWQFDCWRGAISSTLAQTEVIMDADKDITATFSVIQPNYTLYLPLLLRTGTGRAR